MTARDFVQRTFYDADGRVIGALTGEGALTQNLYDGAGRLIRSMAYANLTAAGLRDSGTFDALLGSVTPSASSDAATRYVYDGQGLLRFTIDATE